MAFWNAPFSDSEHAHSACGAALDMLRVLDELNDALANQSAEGTYDLPPVQIGVGINSGSCVVGNMGSAQRFDYTVLGDAVNLASRMESHGTPGRVQISQATQAKLGEEFEVEPRGAIEVKGKGKVSTYFVAAADG